MRNVAWLLAVGALALTAVVVGDARGGQVVFADGRTMDGMVILTAEGRVSVQPVGKLVTSAPISEVKTATFSARPGGDVQSKECDGVKWSCTEVGSGQKAGHADINGNKVTIKDSSEGFKIGKHKADRTAVAAAGCCFVFQKLQGEGEIVAKVTPSDQGPKTTRAGLMICEGLDGTGVMALVSRTPDPIGGTLLSRGAKGDAIVSVGDSRTVPAVPSFLKLVRRVNPPKNEPELEAFESVNGLQWTRIGEIKRFAMDEKAGVYIGVAATGNLREGQATFENIKMTGKRSEPEIAGMVDTRLPEIYTVLSDGTMLAATVDSVTGAEAKLKKPANLGGELVAVATAQLVRAQFAALTRAQSERLQGSASGVLTRDGDFLDGEVKTMTTSAGVTVSSVAFGLTTIERWRVVAAAFSPPVAPRKPEAGLYEVHLQDGSVIVSRKLVVDKEQVVMDEPVLGELKAGIKDVVSFERK